MRRRLLSVLLPTVLASVLAVPGFADTARNFSMKLGATLTITGHTGSVTGKTPAVGKVVVSGRWGTVGPWRVLTTTRTDGAGKYRFSYTPVRRGDLALRIVPPDHQPQRYVLHVR